MIYTQYGEPVEVVSGRVYDLLNPITADVPAYKVRSLNDQSWTAIRMAHELKADGGIRDILDAIGVAESSSHEVPSND